jgi:hypothetical protein
MFKYQIPSYPAIAILTAFSINELSKDLSNIFKINIKKIKSTLTLIIISFSISILFFFYLPMIQKHTKNNLQAAGKYINNLDPEKVIILFHPVGEQGVVWQTYIDEKATKPTPSFIHILDFYSKGKFEYQENEEFLNEFSEENLPSVLVLGTHFYHQFPIEGELKKIINNRYEQGPTFNKYRTGAGIWRVKLTLYELKK